MSAKSQLATMLDFIGENEARYLLQYAKDMLLLKPKTWDDIEEDDPLDDEITIFEEYYAARD